MEYWLLKHRIARSAERRRCRDNLLKLREQLDREVPPKNAESDLLLATWNIRDLAKNNRKGWGERFPESHFYIAEVLSRFDFIAVQEVNELDEWESIVDILGERNWDWIATDISDGSGGNGERLTYLWDKRKVSFENVAGEIVLPTRLLITENVKPKDGAGKTMKVASKTVGKQFRRTPFAAAFQSSWFKFEICTVHIFYGEEKGTELGERIQEIDRIGKYFGKRAKQAFAADRSLILLGDFNIVGHDHETMKALTDSGFRVPPALKTAPPTNSDQTKYYDQIAFRSADDLGYLDIPDNIEPSQDPRAGAVSIFENLYTTRQRSTYGSQMSQASSSRKKDAREDPLGYFKEWRTYQFSDHMPLWVRLKVNDSEEYLKGIK